MDDGLDNTVHSKTASEFLRDSVRAGGCVRCGHAVDAHAENWCSIAKVRAIAQVQNDLTLTGGKLCQPCHTAFGEWMRAGRN